MASDSPKPQSDTESESTAIKIDGHIDNNGDLINLEVDSLRQEFRKSLDLNCVIPDRILDAFDEQPNLLNESQIITVDINKVKLCRFQINFIEELVSLCIVSMKKEIQAGGSSYEPYHSSVEFQDDKIENKVRTLISFLIVFFFF